MGSPAISGSIASLIGVLGMALAWVALRRSSWGQDSLPSSGTSSPPEPADEDAPSAGGATTTDGPASTTPPQRSLPPEDHRPAYGPPSATLPDEARALPVPVLPDDLQAPWAGPQTSSQWSPPSYGLAPPPRRHRSHRAGCIAVAAAIVLAAIALAGTLTLTRYNHGTDPTTSPTSGVSGTQAASPPLSTGGPTAPTAPPTPSAASATVTVTVFATPQPAAVGGGGGGNGAAWIAAVGAIVAGFGTLASGAAAVAALRRNGGGGTGRRPVHHRGSADRRHLRQW